MKFEDLYIGYTFDKDYMEVPKNDSVLEIYYTLLLQP